MWLIEITINSTLYRVSTDGMALAHFWDGHVMKMVPISYEMEYWTGGYVRPRFGGIVFSPELFETEWPPPASCPIKIMLTDTNEAEAITVLEGTAHLSGFGREMVKYDVYGDEYASTINSVTLSDTLVNIFTTYCGAAYLNLALDTTHYGAPPGIGYTTPSYDVPLIDELSKMAAAVNHFFFIKDGTLYLWNMRGNYNDTPITEFDFAPAEYSNARPMSRLESGNYSVLGSHRYGRVKKTVTADCLPGGSVVPQLTVIKNDIAEQPSMRIMVPAKAANIPDFGSRITWTDESVAPGGNTITAAMKLRKMSFVENGEFVVLEGEGTIT